MEHRPNPQLTFAQARYGNTSHPVAPTFPAGCDLFASLSNGDSIARSTIQVAVPTLSVVLLVLWLARRIVNWVQRRRLARMAESWETLPNYTEARAAADALQLKHNYQQHHLSSSSCSDDSSSLAAEDQICTICFCSTIEHPITLLPCGHQQYCAHCIVQLWGYTGAYRQLNCPLCRQPVELVCPVRVDGAKPSFDDVLLLQQYNGGFCGARKHSLLDQWVLRLRAVTNARLLPFVIGLRIVMLHATIFTYMILPKFVPDTAQATARVTEKMVESDSAVACACAAVVRGLLTVLYYAVTYADDLFVMAFSIIVTGSLIQSTLFKDLKL